MTAALTWLVARAKSGRENWALENIIKQGAVPYMPRVMGRRGSLACPRSLFGPYLFVHNINGSWRFLLSTFGVLGVVLFGENPATVSDQIIQGIRAREVDGLVVLPPPPEPGLRWKKNSKLRVKGGVFSGNIGLYQGLGPQSRERLLLDFLGRKTSVLIPTELLEAA